MTVKLIAAAAGLALVASSPALLAALAPALGVAVAAEVVYVARRLRRHPNPRRTAYGA